MAKIDEIKEFIGFLKAIFITLIIMDTSLIAWIFKNYDASSEWKVYIVVSIVILLSIVIYTLFLKILSEISKLKDL